MHHHRPQLIARALLNAEIEQIIVHAGRTRDIVYVEDHAGRLALAYPDAILSTHRIADEIMVAAAKAGVHTEHGNS